MKAEKIKFNLSNLTKVLKSLCKRIGKLWTKNYRRKLIILKEYKKWFECLETFQLEAKSLGKGLPAPSLQKEQTGVQYLKLRKVIIL